MSTDRPDQPGGVPSSSRIATRTAIIGVAIVILLGLGWFALSHLVMDTATSDAIGEALGVILGLLIVLSVVGALTAQRDDVQDDER